MSTLYIYVVNITQSHKIYDVISGSGNITCNIYVGNRYRCRYVCRHEIAHKKYVLPPRLQVKSKKKVFLLVLVRT